MEHLSKLRASRDKAQVAYHEFILSLRKYEKSLFCFMEGKDNSYYIPIIKKYTDSYVPIRCGGRENVLHVYKLIIQKNEYKDRYKLAFFIDRDFNPALTFTDSPIFETPCYSIENLYTSTNTFKEILINEFNLSLVIDEDLINIYLNLYTERQEQFHEAILLLNAWYSCLIDIRNYEERNINVRLEEKWPKGFINFNIHGITSNYSYEEIIEKFNPEINIDRVILNDKINLFKTLNKRLVFRGKYEIQFLIKFIQMIIHDSFNDKLISSNRLQFAFGDASSLNNQQILSIFQKYSEIPPSLIEYIENIFKKYQE